MEQFAGDSTWKDDGSESQVSGITASASSVRLWYLVAVERSSALTADDEQRIRGELVGGRRHCAALIACSPQLVALVAEMVVEAKHDPRNREWFRHGQHSSSLEVISQLVVEAERAFKAEPMSVDSPSLQEGLTDRIERLRLSLTGIAELVSRATDRRAVAARLTEELGTWRDRLRLCRNELIDKHLDLVLSELRRMPRFGADKRELLQEGNLGLMRAAELFDERGDLPFVAYALCWIRAFMRRVIETKRGSVRLPADVCAKLGRLRQHSILLDQTTGQAATVAQLAGATGLEEREVRRLVLVRGLAFEVAPSAAHSEPCSIESKSETGVSALDALVELELIKAVGAAMECLNEREALVISERYGFRQSAVTSRPIIAKKLGVSAERVRQIENAALAKIAQKFSDVGVSAEEVGALVFNASVA